MLARNPFAAGEIRRTLKAGSPVRTMRVLALLLVGVLSLVAQAERAVVTDLDGRRVEPLDPADGARATALIFMRADCPLAGQTAPEILRVVKSAGRDGRVWLVYVDGADPVERIRTHVAEYGLTARVVRDPDHVLVTRAGVHVTPEAALYVHDKGDTTGVVFVGGVVETLGVRGSGECHVSGSG